jgi:hypothetical protein
MPELLTAEDYQKLALEQLGLWANSATGLAWKERTRLLWDVYVNVRNKRRRYLFVLRDLLLTLRGRNWEVTDWKEADVSESASGSTKNLSDLYTWVNEQLKQGANSRQARSGPIERTAPIQWDDDLEYPTRADPNHPVFRGDPRYRGYR